MTVKIESTGTDYHGHTATEAGCTLGVTVKHTRKTTYKKLVYGTAFVPQKLTYSNPETGCTVIGGWEVENYGIPFIRTTHITQYTPNPNYDQEITYDDLSSKITHVPEHIECSYIWCDNWQDTGIGAESTCETKYTDQAGFWSLVDGLWVDNTEKKMVPGYGFVSGWYQLPGNTIFLEREYATTILQYTGWVVQEYWTIETDEGEEITHYKSEEAARNAYLSIHELTAVDASDHVQAFVTESEEEAEFYATSQILGDEVTYTRTEGNTTYTYSSVVTLDTEGEAYASFVYKTEENCDYTPCLPVSYDYGSSGSDDEYSTLWIPNGLPEGVMVLGQPTLDSGTGKWAWNMVNTESIPWTFSETAVSSIEGVQIDTSDIENVRTYIVFKHYGVEYFTAELKLIDSSNRTYSISWISDPFFNSNNIPPPTTGQPVRLDCENWSWSDEENQITWDGATSIDFSDQDNMLRFSFYDTNEFIAYRTITHTQDEEDQASSNSSPSDSSDSSDSSDTEYSWVITEGQPPEGRTMVGHPINIGDCYWKWADTSGVIWTSTNCDPPLAFEWNGFSITAEKRQTSGQNTDACGVWSAHNVPEDALLVGQPQPYKDIAMWYWSWSDHNGTIWKTIYCDSNLQGTQEGDADKTLRFYYDNSDTSGMSFTATYRDCTEEQSSQGGSSSPSSSPSSSSSSGAEGSSSSSGEEADRYTQWTTDDLPDGITFTDRPQPKYYKGYGWVWGSDEGTIYVCEIDNEDATYLAFVTNVEGHDNSDSSDSDSSGDSDEIIFTARRTRLLAGSGSSSSSDDSSNPVWVVRGLSCTETFTVNPLPLYNENVAGWEWSSDSSTTYTAGFGENRTYLEFYDSFDSEHTTVFTATLEDIGPGASNPTFYCVQPWKAVNVPDGYSFAGQPTESTGTTTWYDASGAEWIMGESTRRMTWYDTDGNKWITDPFSSDCDAIEFYNDDCTNLMFVATRKDTIWMITGLPEDMSFFLTQAQPEYIYDLWEWTDDSNVTYAADGDASSTSLSFYRYSDSGKAEVFKANITDVGTDQHKRILYYAGENSESDDSPTDESQSSEDIERHWIPNDFPTDAIIYGQPHWEEEVSQYVWRDSDGKTWTVSLDSEAAAGTELTFTRSDDSQYSFTASLKEGTGHWKIDSVPYGKTFELQSQPKYSDSGWYWRSDQNVEYLSAGSADISTSVMPKLVFYITDEDGNITIKFNAYFTYYVDDSSEEVEPKWVAHNVPSGYILYGQPTRESDYYWKWQDNENNCWYAYVSDGTDTDNLLFTLTNGSTGALVAVFSATLETDYYTWWEPDLADDTPLYLGTSTKFTENPQPTYNDERLAKINSTYWIWNPDGWSTSTRRFTALGDPGDTVLTFTECDYQGEEALAAWMFRAYLTYKVNEAEDESSYDSSSDSSSSPEEEDDGIAITKGDLTGGTVSGGNITSGEMLSGTIIGGIISGGTVEGEYLVDCTVTDCTVANATLAGCSISGCTVTESAVKNATMAYPSATGSTTSDIYLSGSTITRCIISNGSMTEASINHCTLNHCRIKIERYSLRQSSLGSALTAKDVTILPRDSGSSGSGSVGGGSMDSGSATGGSVDGGSSSGGDASQYGDDAAIEPPEARQMGCGVSFINPTIHDASCHGSPKFQNTTWAAKLILVKGWLYGRITLKTREEGTSLKYHGYIHCWWNTCEPYDETYEYSGYSERVYKRVGSHCTGCGYTWSERGTCCDTKWGEECEPEYNYQCCSTKYSLVSYAAKFYPCIYNPEFTVCPSAARYGDYDYTSGTGNRNYNPWEMVSVRAYANNSDWIFDGWYMVESYYKDVYYQKVSSSRTYSYSATRYIAEAGSCEQSLIGLRAVFYWKSNSGKLYCDGSNILSNKYYFLGSQVHTDSVPGRDRFCYMTIKRCRDHPDECLNTDTDSTWWPTK